VAELEPDLVADLLRSAWIVERARWLVLEDWAAHEPRFGPWVRRAAERTRIVQGAVERIGGPDPTLAEDHAVWIRGCVPHHAETFGDLFLARLGGWVDAHVAPALHTGADRLCELGREEAASIAWPDVVPAAPPFEPLESAPDPAERSRLRIGVLGDLHIGSTGADILARAAITDLNASRPDVVVQLGDLTDHGNADEFSSAAQVLARLEAPWLAIMGNHDTYSTAEKALSGPQHFERHFGRAPEGSLVERRGVKIAALDSIELAVSPFPPYDLVAGAFAEGQGGALVRGVLSPAQHDILAEVAAPGGGPAFVFLHHPPQPFTGFPPIIFGLREDDSGRLHATCDSGNVWGVFAGHTHRNHRGRPLARVPVLEVASPRDFPFGYALIDVFDEGYSYRFVQLAHPELLSDGYARTSAIQRRYSLGTPHERAFEWRAADA
jgi:hypothetical protein